MSIGRPGATGRFVLAPASCPSRPSLWGPHFSLSAFQTLARGRRPPEEESGRSSGQSSTALARLLICIALKESAGRPGIELHPAGLVLAAPSRNSLIARAGRPRPRPLCFRWPRVGGSADPTEHRSWPGAATTGPSESDLRSNSLPFWVNDI